MPQTVEISSINFSGEQVNIIFTPQGTETSYGLGLQTLPYIFDSSIIGNNINVQGSYSINIINSNCTHILVIS
jgi:hypothetical protein